MVTCAVSWCKNSSSKNSKNKHGITFHRFPRDIDRRQRWELAVNRGENWSSTPSSSVCSEHFNAKDFYVTENGLRKLNFDAVPSINVSPCQDSEPTISQLLLEEDKLTLCQLPLPDIKPTDSEEVVQLKHKVHRLQIISEQRRKKLHKMWASKKKLKVKLSRMEEMVKHLVRIKRDKKMNR